MTPHVVKWIEENAKDDNWFLYVNFWDPHTPYRTPDRFENPFTNDPLPEWLTEEVFEEHKKNVGPHGALELNMYDNQTRPEYPKFLGELNDMADLRKMVDGYDSGVRWMDENIGQIVKTLEEQELWTTL